MVLLAAFLGWLFDGYEIGLFPVIARPALKDLLGGAGDAQVGRWMGIITFAFLMGAALGGLVFGWLGDRIGRVKAMALSILTYSLVTGLGYFAAEPSHLGWVRFISALGMGGQWSLGVALVMECWPEKWRPLLAGAIGAAANVGFLLVGFTARLHQVTPESWRWMLIVAALPALLVVFIIAAVPESERWKRAVLKEPSPVNYSSLRLFLGNTGIGLLICAAIPLLIIMALGIDGVQRRSSAVLSAFIHYLIPHSTSELLQWIAVVLSIVLLCVFFGVFTVVGSIKPVFAPPLRKNTFLAIGFASFALIGTWGSVQWLPLWANQMVSDQGFASLRSQHPEWYADQTNAEVLQARTEAETIVKQEAGKATANMQMIQGLGAIIGTLLAPLVGARLGRRPAYFLLCFSSFLICAFTFRSVDVYTLGFLGLAFVMSLCTASFYGWFPLYFPELFPTRVRATGQGLSYNFGRVFAAIGAMTQGQLVATFNGSYAQAGAIVTLIYLLGMVLIWFAPETKGKPLPD